MSRILISDLTALSSETKRKHPHVRLACETALAALKQDADDALTTAANDFGPPLENLLLKPILLACETKVPKAIALGVALLQRVIGMNAVPEVSDEGRCSRIKCANFGHDLTQLHVDLF